MAIELAEAAPRLHALASEIEAYQSNTPAGDRYIAPIIDAGRPDEHGQRTVQGLKKFHGLVADEREGVDVRLSTTKVGEEQINYIAYQAVWDAFRRATPPVLGLWQTLHHEPGGAGPSTKVEVVANGGDEWIKVNTIKERTLLADFRENDSYINEDWESDNPDDFPGGSQQPPRAVNALLDQATAVVNNARTYPRGPGLPPPRVKYILTRLHPTDHADPRIGETLDAMRAMGIEIQFGADTGPLRVLSYAMPSFVPATNVVVDLSALIALCSDSTHHPLPTTEGEIDTRFRAISDLGSDLDPAMTFRDLRAQLVAETGRPLVGELIARFSNAGVTPRFWVTREVREHIPTLMKSIGGQVEAKRAAALFDPSTGDFWAGSRWAGKTGVLRDMHVRVLEDGDGDGSAPVVQEAATAFDSVVALTLEAMIGHRDAAEAEAEAAPVPAKVKTKNGRPKLIPLGVRVRMPSGHTLRTMREGVRRRATVLTNNRGAVGRVLRDAGVADGIPRADGEEGGTWGRIWLFNPSSLTEKRRRSVEEQNAKEAVNGGTGGASSATEHVDEGQKNNNVNGN